MQGKVEICGVNTSKLKVLKNEETMELAKAFCKEKAVNGVVGADIAGPEGFVPMAHFEGMFKRVYQAGVPFTIHAGECGDYENVVRAVAFGAKRIGHGCAAIQSEECMRLLEREKNYSGDVRGEQFADKGGGRDRRSSA